MLSSWCSHASKLIKEATDKPAWTGLRAGLAESTLPALRCTASALSCR